MKYHRQALELVVAQVELQDCEPVKNYSFEREQLKDGIKYINGLYKHVLRVHRNEVSIDELDAIISLLSCYQGDLRSLEGVRCEKLQEVY